MFLMLAMAAAMAPEAAEVKIFGDWAVACDNTRRCEAVALVPPERIGDDPTQARIERAAGPSGEMTIRVWPPEARGSMEVRLDGRTISRVDVADDGARVDGETALLLAREMANGRELTLREHDLAVATVSLAGLSATLRYIDDRQGRAGNLSAAVALGTAPASGTPAAPPVPRVRAFPPVADGAMVREGLAAELARRGDCAPETWLPGVEPEFWWLEGRTILALIPCGSGAYNFNSAVFVVRGDTAEPARFDVAPDWVEGGGVPIVTNAQFEGGMLTNFAKGRGLGDCGVLQNWVWDGERFRLVLGQRLEECRGSIEWPTVYRAEPEYR